MHASVFPKELTRAAVAVSPYKDVCFWKEGWRKRRETRAGGIEGGKRNRKEEMDRWMEGETARKEKEWGIR